LRALEVHEFPMPSNTVVPAETRRELVAEVAETMPPREKNYFPKKRKWVQNMFLTNFFFPKILIITTLSVMAGHREQPREQA